MNEYMFYTEEGYTYAPSEEQSVENCQVLGTAFGENVETARNQLEKEQPWIKDCGFDITVSSCRQLLSEENRKDIGLVVRYLMENKFCHHPKAGDSDSDVYNALMRLKNSIG